MVPDPEHKPNTDKTRGEAATETEFPKIDGAEYLLRHLNNMGWYGSGGMGAAPLTFAEIDAYNRLTNASLLPDEALLLRKMSAAYVSELNDRSITKHPPYYTKTPDPIKGADLASVFAAIGTVRSGGKV